MMLQSTLVVSEVVKAFNVVEASFFSSDKKFLYCAAKYWSSCCHARYFAGHRTSIIGVCVN